MQAHPFYPIVVGILIGVLATRIGHWSLCRQCCALRQSHLGVLSPAATRYELARERRCRDVIAIDIRKLHDLNAVLGWDRANSLVAQWISMARREGDLWGQYGGDELVAVVPPGDGSGLLERLQANAQAVADQMTEETRATLWARTGGLVDGFCIAACLLEGAGDVRQATADALEAAQQLKVGRVTGERSTSGAVGTVVCVRRAA